MKVGQVLMPLRLAVTGTTASPPLMASIRVLGIDRAIDRVKAVIALLGQS
jgi:glutamyl-tRNA synthetase